MEKKKKNYIYINKRKKKNSIQIIRHGSVCVPFLIRQKQQANQGSASQPSGPAVESQGSRLRKPGELRSRVSHQGQSSLIFTKPKTETPSELPPHSLRSALLPSHIHSYVSLLDRNSLEHTQRILQNVWCDSSKQPKHREGMPAGIMGQLFSMGTSVKRLITLQSLRGLPLKSIPF